MPLDPLPNHLRYLILAIQAEGERRLDGALRDAGIDLTATQSEVLEVLCEGGAMSQAMLARRLVCTKGNISRLLDRMEAKRLLRRRPDPGDRRRVLVEATDHGSRAFEAALAILETITGTLRSLYSDDELFQLVRLLSRMAEALGLSLEDRFPASKGA